MSNLTTGHMLSSIPATNKPVNIIFLPLVFHLQRKWLPSIKMFLTANYNSSYFD